jgi:DNA-binding CsgD family transcriptional regulator
LSEVATNGSIDRLKSSESFKSSFPNLVYEDVKALLQVVGDACHTEGSMRVRKRVLMQGIADLTDSDCWLWVVFPPTQPGEKPTAVDSLSGGFGDEQFARFLQAVEHPQMGRLNAPFIESVIHSEGQVTALRQDIDKDGIFPTLEVYELWREANVAPLVLSARVLDSGFISNSCFYRHFDRELYTKREERLIQALFDSLEWFHSFESEEKLVIGNKLTPRMRTILNLMIEGASRKEIAANLNISVNTVSSYVRDIYRTYEVHSQTELLKHFRDN